MTTFFRVNRYSQTIDLVNVPDTYSTLEEAQQALIDVMDADIEDKISDLEKAFGEKREMLEVIESSSNAETGESILEALGRETERVDG